MTQGSGTGGWTNRRVRVTAILLLVAGCAVWVPSKLWTKHDLNACFYDSASVPASVRQQVVRAAVEWEKFAYLHFDFGADSANPQLCRNDQLYDVTIALRSDGSWSAIGAQSARMTWPSMNLDVFTDTGHTTTKPPVEFNRIVLHEFGHAIGFEHEFQSPSGNCAAHLNWNKVTQLLGQHFGWSAKMVQDNLGSMDTSYDAMGDEMQSTPFDRDSVMLYALPAEAFTDGEKDTCFIPKLNAELSATDKRIAGELYPKPTADLTD